MNKNKKIALTGFSILGASALVLTGAFAVFSNFTTQDVGATGGTVSISTIKATLTNQNNINPGDNDFTLTDPTRNDGTEHKLRFGVTNTGTKSIKTRNVIVIDVKDKDGKYLSPDEFFLAKDGIEAEKKYYIVNGEDIPVNEYKSGQIEAVKYIITTQVLDGAGEPLSADGSHGVAEVENRYQTTSANYVYDFGMKGSAEDIYQGCKVNIRVDVQAMQYRNTSSNDWKTVFSDGIQASAK